MGVAKEPQETAGESVITAGTGSRPHAGGAGMGGRGDAGPITTQHGMDGGMDGG